LTSRPRARAAERASGRGRTRWPRTSGAPYRAPSRGAATRKPSPPPRQSRPASLKGPLPGSRSLAATWPAEGPRGRRPDPRSRRGRAVEAARPAVAWRRPRRRRRSSRGPARAVGPWVRAAMGCPPHPGPPGVHDPGQVLANGRQTWTGPEYRHFHEGDQIDERALKALIRAAVALNTSSAQWPGTRG